MPVGAGGRSQLYRHLTRLAVGRVGEWVGGRSRDAPLWSAGMDADSADSCEMVLR